MQTGWAVGAVGSRANVGRRCGLTYERVEDGSEKGALEVLRQVICGPVANGIAVAGNQKLAWDLTLWAKWHGRVPG